jgi:hypothetical protein
VALHVAPAASYASGTVWSYEYDDVALLITRVLCDNTTAPGTTKGTATVLKNGRTYTVTVEPGGALDQRLPLNQAQRFEITIDAEGRIDGVDWHTEYLEPPPPPPPEWTGPPG